MADSFFLNLARVWRSKTFDEIVGQKLSMKLLKNSLYKGYFFPVYLLSGQRGSGKTSTGRIFASAINCEQLSNFKLPGYQGQFPCLVCQSCDSMRRGNHPDFIEIDAASHTGVDNVRQIIEAASFLPVMGNKKIYLIDEAHMLSKAACNAFLKILEEPPATALFLLATTDSDKILDTVKSRSFQLFFEPVSVDDMVPHLKRVCAQESIVYEDEALRHIAQASEGSIRDALNNIERVRLMDSTISVKSVFAMLGAIHDVQIIELFAIMAQGSLQKLGLYCVEIKLSSYSAMVLWKKIIEVIRTLLWLHQGIDVGIIQGCHDSLKKLILLYSFALLIEMLDKLYKIEAHFIKTSAQYILIESFLYKTAQRFVKASGAPSLGSVEIYNHAQKVIATKSGVVHESVQDSSAQLQSQLRPNAQSNQEEIRLWESFLKKLTEEKSSLASSIFYNANFIEWSGEVVRVRFDKKFSFYSDWIVSNEVVWRPSLKSVFGQNAALVSEFVHKQDSFEPANNLSLGSSIAGDAVVKRMQSSDFQDKNQKIAALSGDYSCDTIKKKQNESTGVTIDINNKEKWPTAQTVLAVFPGTMRVLKE